MTSDLICPECGERLPADAPRRALPGLPAQGRTGQRYMQGSGPGRGGKHVPRAGPGAVPWRVHEGLSPVGRSGGGGPGSREVVTRSP